MENLEEVQIFWNIRADNLWNFSRNCSLRALSVQDAKRMTLKPKLLKTSKTLETVAVSGSAFNTFLMESLSCFEGMPALRSPKLRQSRQNDRNMAVLKTLFNMLVEQYRQG